MGDLYACYAGMRMFVRHKTIGGGLSSEIDFMGEIRGMYRVRPGRNVFGTDGVKPGKSAGLGMILTAGPGEAA